MTHVRTPRLALTALVSAAVSLATGRAGPAPEEPGPMTEFYVDPAPGIDLGTAADSGGNDYSGNDEPLILDARPARPAADGTVITISYADTLSPCLTGVQPVIGTAAMGCGGVTAISILNANDRVEVTFSP